MKQFFAVVATAMITLSASAQLPDGSIAPDFTATDIDGVEHNLQAYLDQGITVILDFSATWCGPCWAYHTDHVMGDLYDTFGASGSGDLMVFHMEADDATTQADLEGSGANTAGDWITGTTFPIIDNAGSIFDDYAGTYFPTIYTICPDGILTESGQANFASHASDAFDGCDNEISGPAPLSSYNGATTSCGDSQWTASTLLTNYGAANMTSATFDVMLNGNSNAVNWTGNIGPGASASVDLGSFDDVGNLAVSLVEVNAEPWNATEELTIIGSVESTTYVQVRITTDNWPEETGWEITDDAGNEIASVAVGELAGSADTPFTWDVGLPSTGCYSFTMFDSYGDGLYASQWGDFADGTAGVFSMNGPEQVGTIWSYNGASGEEFGEANAGLEASSVAGIAEGTLSSTVNIFPNPTVGMTNVEFNTKSAEMASVEVFNLIGERVMFTDLGNLPAGMNRVTLDLGSVKAGIYLVNLNAGGETSTLRVTKH